MRTAHKARSLMVAAAALVAAGCGSPSDDPADDPVGDTVSAGGTASTPTQTPTQSPTSASPTPELAAPETSEPSSARSDRLELTAGAGIAGRCVPPTPSSLRDVATYAFDGEVTEIDDDQVTIKPDQWYADAEDAQSVVVTAPPAAVRDLVQGAEFAVGERYLVAANEDREVLVCGFTTPQTPSATRLYEQAFGQ